MVKTIPLSRGLHTIVDDEDYSFLVQWKWYVNNNGYAVRNQQLDCGKRITILMHRVLLNAEVGAEVDHKDGNRLNNRRSNIRTCTKTENNWNSKKRVHNTSGYKGVTWCKRNQKWLAQIVVDGHKKHLGYYRDVVEAANAYNTSALNNRGEYAWLNAV